MAGYMTSTASMFKTTQGLSETYDSNSYRIAEIETHLHSSGQIWGLTSNTMARKSTSPIIVTGGNGAWGTELELTTGSVIESGSSTKRFDLNQMFVTAVGTSNRVTMLEFYYGTRGTAVAATTQAAADTITKNGHGLLDGDKIALDSIVTSTNINNYTTYYVVNKAANTFQVSLTLGGAAVDIQTNDGTCTYAPLTQTLFTEQVVSRVATTSDTFPIILQSRRVMCSNRLWCRGWAAGGTNAISFFLGLHVYSA